MECANVVKIPHGFSSNGTWDHNVELRLLNGYDEQYMGQILNYPLPVRTTLLLERIAKFDKSSNGSGNRSSQKADAAILDIIKDLTVGDRVALMLHFRRLAIGDKISCSLVCPACRNPMSFDLSISNLLQPVICEPIDEYAISIEEYKLKVRPVTGRDQEAMFENNYDTPDRSRQAEILARSCITYSEPSDLPNKLSDDFVASISSKLAELDPQADIVLEPRCPSCQDLIQSFFNVEDFVFREIYSRHRQIEQEVHWMAFNYHWSEESILSLSARKRKRYVELINRTLSGDSL